LSSTVISLSPTKYHLSLSLVIIRFVNFVVSAPTLTSKLPVPLPHLLFNISLITATLCTTTFQNLKQIVQVIQNSLARAVVKAPKFCHITPILKSLHLLKINERIEYKLLSLTYKTLTTAQPSYLHSLVSVQPPRATRSSSVVTLSRPPTSSSLKITNRSFRYASSSLESTSCLISPALHKTPC